MATATHQLYVFKGRSRDGKVVEGEMAAASAAMAKAQLRKQGILPRTVRKKPKPLFGQKKIKPANIATFTRQLATMTRAGVPLVQSFEIVAEGEENSSMKTLIERIHADVSSGTGFAAALRAHPKYFDNLFCSLIDAGEQSGTLETMLARVATYKEKTEALKRKIKKAMTYPSAVILVAIFYIPHKLGGWHHTELGTGYYAIVDRRIAPRYGNFAPPPQFAPPSYRFAVAAVGSPFAADLAARIATQSGMIVPRATPIPAKTAAPTQLL